MLLGGFMWYAVFKYSLIVLEFGSCALLGYMAIQLQDAELAGPFFFLLPLPVCLIYFGRYCDHKFQKASMVSNITYIYVLFSYYLSLSCIESIICFCKRIR